MTGLRAPVVAGVGGGVGTTTLAVALRGNDGGRAGVDVADVLACRGSLDSLRRATTVLERVGPAHAAARPVLAVTLDGRRAPRGSLLAHLELLEETASAVVLLPHVARWRTVGDPLQEAAHLLVEPVDRLPRPLRAYTTGLRELVAALTASGRLQAAPQQGRRAGSPGPAGADPVVDHAGRAEAPGDVRRRSGPPPAPAAGPRVVGAFRPVVGPVSGASTPVVGPVRSRAAEPAAEPAAGPAVEPAAEPAPRRRGVRIVPVERRPAGLPERIEQVG